MSLNVKEEAQRLIASLPENITWDDVMHEIYVRQAIDRGISDSREGRSMSVREVREKYGLPRSP